MNSNIFSFVDPDLDLVFEPETSLTAEQIWRGWTDPVLLPKWFCPKPWHVSECRIDLRLGGEFFTRMQGPSGEVVDNHGCLLEISPMNRLVITNVFHKGLRPVLVAEPDFPNLIEILLGTTAPNGKYRAIVRHASSAHRTRHVAMGFPQGWDIALNQLEKFFSNET